MLPPAEYHVVDSAPTVESHERRRRVVKRKRGVNQQKEEGREEKVAESITTKALAEEETDVTKATRSDDSRTPFAFPFQRHLPIISQRRLPPCTTMHQ
jgi:alpha-D-ribose 1-methylphosphonate 5-triphosphate synthase subunit PhnI